MKKIKIWLDAFRLRTLPLSMSGILVGSALAFHDGFWNSGIFIFSLTTTLFFQILSNLSNDLGDHLKGTDNENRVGPMRSTQSGDISAAQMTNAVRLFVVLSLFSSAVLIYLSTEILTTQAIWVYIFLGVGAILAALLYTLGKNAYGYSGFGDVFVFIFFGLVSVLGVYGLYTSQLAWHYLSVAVGIGLLSTAVLNLNNLRDHVNDKEVKKRTLVVKLGFEKGKIYHVFLIVGACLSFAFFILPFQPLTYVILLLTLPLLIHLQRVVRTTNPSDLDPELKKVALTTFFLSVAITILINL